jgi:hypothetical protein
MAAILIWRIMNQSQDDQQKSRSRRHRSRFAKALRPVRMGRDLDNRASTSHSPRRNLESKSPRWNDLSPSPKGPSARIHTENRPSGLPSKRSVETAALKLNDFLHRRR